MTEASLDGTFAGEPVRMIVSVRRNPMRDVIDPEPRTFFPRSITQRRIASVALLAASAMLFPVGAMCGKLVDSGNGDHALVLIESTPTRISGGLLAFIIVAPLVLSGVIVAVVLALTLHR